MKIGHFDTSKIHTRDYIAGAFGFVSGGLGIVGALVKKTMVHKDDSFLKKTGIFLATSILTGGTGAIPYLLARSGEAARNDVDQARQAAGK